MKASTSLDNNKCCVIIPTYNNERTLEEVLTEVLRYSASVIVVDDGSTDNTASILKKYNGQIEIVNHQVNLGKGKALRNAFKMAMQHGYTHAITIDSDGQHFPSDLPAFIKEAAESPSTLVIGARNMTQENVPGKSSFGNKFSNFWYWVETGIKLDDTQSGFRLYPIRALEKIKFITNRFEFEIEVIVKAVWKGLRIKNIPIKIYYEPSENRVSHFRPFTDFTRISILNAYLVTLALFYYIPRRFFKSLTRENIRRFINLHLLNKDEAASRKAYSIGFGVFMGIFPIWGYQMLVGLSLAALMKLNKALFLIGANISIPPVIPFIVYGSYRLGALLVNDPRNDILFTAGFSLELVKDNFIQYATGAIALAIISGISAASITYSAIVISRYRSR